MYLYEGFTVGLFPHPACKLLKILQSHTFHFLKRLYVCVYVCINVRMSVCMYVLYICMCVHIYIYAFT